MNVRSPSEDGWDADDYDSRFAFVTDYGAQVLDLLAAKPGERVLDLGCGTGHHAAELSGSGIDVVGLDADESMLRRAREAYGAIPGLRFVRADAQNFGLAALGEPAGAPAEPFDAVVSNAALHWMTEQREVLRCVHGVLRPGGRFVAEMGGEGNIATVDRALRQALADLGVDPPVPTNYFPSTAKQATALEDVGFRVELVQWFRRPTPLSGTDTPADWTAHFRAAAWAGVPVGRRAELRSAIERYASDWGLLTEAGWVVDYCRLRFVARVA